MKNEVEAVLRDYPRVYFACHRRHVRDPRTQALLSAHQASILDHLDAVDATTLGELAEHMGVTPGTMSVAIDRLVKGGYVSRTPDATDRRRVQLRLTADGVRMRGANSVLDPALIGSMLEQLEPGARAEALRGLALLAQAAAAAQRQRGEDAGVRSRRRA
ncbi:MAG TPA: MarR family transcriptional regulator [Gemmatimonadaceae bacterium]|nr:MarR family transcriptional regulator [Gemmatimonadaceae bacterium]